MVNQLEENKILGLPRLYFESIRGLSAGQVLHLLQHRLRRGPAHAAAVDGSALRLSLPTPRCERARMPATPELAQGRFTAWNATKQLDLQRPWDAPDLGRSWTYVAQYFDGIPAWACAQPDSANAIIDLMRTWITAHPPASGAAWDPYPIALRIVNWIDVLQILGDAVSESARDPIAASLWTQAACLHRRLELHLRGTHLLKDAKALLLASRVFDGDRARAWGRRAEELWRREIALQVQPDGGHIEASIMYHGLALGDLLDVLNWKLGSDELQAETARVAQRMLDFLSAVQTPAGEYPLFGDSGTDAVPSPRALLEFGARLGFAVRAASPGLSVCGDAGYAVWRDDRQYCIAKIGGIEAQHVAAHAHCDSLSFEWHVDGVPILVDSGVQSYEPGPRRFASRGTRAHNTLQIDGQEQQEIWAAFRVARRATVASRALGDDAVEVRLVPWHDRRLEVVRCFSVVNGSVQIQDRVRGPGRHRVESRLHFHPDCHVEPTSNGFRVVRGALRAEITISAPGRQVSFGAAPSFHCERMGVAVPNTEVAIEGELPFESSMELRPS